MHNNQSQELYEPVSPEQVLEWLQAKEIVLVDVREPDEWDAEHIEGAMLVPLSAFDPHAIIAAAGEELGIVFYCKVGGRADRVCQYFVQATGRAATCMEGSILGWKAQGLPVVSGS